MPLNPEQIRQRAAFISDLGDDKLVIRRFDGFEEINTHFEYRVEAVSDDSNIDFNSVIGTKCKVRITSAKDVKRFFNGVLVETRSLARSRDLTQYELVLRPWFWLLSKRSNCRIFKDSRVTDIISDVLGPYSFATHEDRTNGSYPRLEYCVQYNESDYDFLCRLMQEYGIYYFFEHSENDHKLVLADSASAHKPKLGGAPLRFKAYEEQHLFEEETLNEWSKMRRFASGAFTLDDFNYLKPKESLLAEKSGGGGYENESLEVFHNFGRYAEKSTGEDKAKAMLEAEQSSDGRYRAAGTAVTCAPGGKIELQDKPATADHEEYMILKANHRYDAPDYRSSGVEVDDLYTGDYEFLPASVQYRGLQTAPKPRISGPLTAFVTGSGEIDVDDQGRIEVMFHWSPHRENKSSRRVRIAHGWAGKNWGDIKIPRVGMEVIVEFLNGDPDFPLVTGCVYNADNTTPYGLPSEKTISGTKSQTVSGSGYNEFIFDDKSGSELIRFHAQRDLDGTVEHDERRHVMNDVTVKIDNNRTEKIGVNWKAEAGSKIELICGQSSIVMTPAKITIKSLSIEINASADLQSKAGAVAKHESSGPLIIQGAIVKIN